MTTVNSIAQDGIQNLVPRESMEARRDWLQALSKIADLGLSLLAPNGNAELFCSRVCDLLEVPVGVVWTMDDEQHLLKVEAVTGSVDESFRQITLDVNSEGIKRHLRSRKLAFIPDIREPDRRYSHAVDATRQGWISLLTKPLYAGERLIGMLDIYTTEERRFSEWEKMLFDIAGNQFALHLQRDSLIHILRHSDGNQDDAETGSLSRLVQDLSKVTGAEYCNLWIYNRHRHSLQSRVCESGFLGEDKSSVPKIINNGDGIAGRVAHSQSSLYVPDVTTLGFDPVEPGRSLLVVPLLSEHDLLGVLTISSRKKDAFSRETQKTIEALLSEVSRVVLQVHSREMLRRLAGLTVEAQSLDAYVDELSKVTQMLLRASSCVIWLPDREQSTMQSKAVARAGTEHAVGDSRSFPIHEARLIFDACTATVPSFGSPIQAEKHRCAYPVSVDGRQAAIIEIGSNSPFQSWRLSLLENLAQQAAAAIRNFGRKEALTHLNAAFLEIAAAESEKDVVEKLLQAAVNLTGATLGCVLRLKPTSGELVLSCHVGERPNIPERMPLGLGITGSALKHRKPILANDVTSRPEYQRFWEGVKAELAVPIYVRSAQIREEATLTSAPRALGVLNVESRTKGFIKFHQECLIALANHSAAVLDRLEFDEKLLKLHEAESELAAMITRLGDWGALVDRVLDSITDTLGYAHVNLSLVTLDGLQIKTELVRGSWIKGERAQEFKKLAAHPVGGDDIQAVVLRTKQILVPRNNSPNFDREIHNRFNLGQLVRVYIPMILDGIAIGTLEAGYPRSFKAHIYERDVQLLNRFVDYATAAIGRRRKGLLDKIGHEFKAAIRGIQDNADFVRRHRASLGDDKIEHKFKDIMTDCDVLYLQVGHLEYYLSGRAPAAQPELTLVGRDVFIKTIHQMQPILAQHGFYVNQISFDYSQLKDVRAFIDKAQLCEVVMNLFTNALKYRRADGFRMNIEALETGASYVLRIQDWGIGVAAGLEEKIFEEGFRAPEAIARVGGTGFGLTISRQIMRQMGGDLCLSSNSNPTEFKITLPKRAK